MSYRMHRSTWFTYGLIRWYPSPELGVKAPALGLQAPEIGLQVLELGVESPKLGLQAL